ncbi:AI-2E family transporter, partial [Sulfurimonas sp. SAG-AH-194-C21]
MQENKIGYLFIVMASVVVILAGIKSASAILVPFLLSLFIAIILSPLYHYFKSKKVPEGLALVLVMSTFLVVLALVGKLIGTSVTDFSANIAKDFNKKKKWIKVGLKSEDVRELDAHHRRQETINLMRMGEEPNFIKERRQDKKV